MRFPYLAFASRSPVHSLGGATTRHLPIFALTALHTGALWTVDALLDSGASDTVFPLGTAQRLGIDLSQAPPGQSQQVGGVLLSYRFSRVGLRLSDGKETCDWEADIGFFDSPKVRRALLGHAGFLQFFDVALLGADREVVLTPNRSFPGRHVIH